MHTYFIISAIVLAYAGLQVPLWKVCEALKHLPQFDEQYNEFLKEREDFMSEKLLHASREAGALCRRCNTCNRVCHKYDIYADGTVECSDCKQGK